MEELFYSNHPLSYSGGMRGTVPPSANFDDYLPPLATGIPKLRTDIFEFGVANQVGVKKDKLSSVPVRCLFL